MSDGALQLATSYPASPPDFMRDLVEAAINLHLPKQQLAVLQAAEQSERELLRSWARRAA